MNNTNENRAYHIKIIPPSGYSVYRLSFTWRHIAGLALVALLALAGAAAYHTYQIHAAQDRLRQLESTTDVQRAKLGKMNAQADAISNELKTLQEQNREIRRMLGADGKRSPRDNRQSAIFRPHGGTSLAEVEHRLADLALVSRQATSDEARLRGTTARILNLRRVTQIARMAMLAAIPSLNPTGTAVASGFGYRVDPFPEFHQGVDLEGDYGAQVRASAAGTVVTAGWDGGYGNKVDIDHGNGYHTWYAHLSAFKVRPGQRVVKGQPIALVGATGEATGPHLHYQVMYNGHAIDPRPFLDGVPPRVVASVPE